MSGSTSKKIVAVRFDREPVQGFVNLQSYLDDTGIEMITNSGEVVRIAYPDVKAVCFVRDFDPGPVWKFHRAFANRPKAAGLWIRLQFRDGDTMEGVIGNDLMLLEGHGFSVAPPDGGFQNKVFVPRAAVAHVQVLGVIGSPLRRTPKPKPGDKNQLKMFE